MTACYAFKAKPALAYVEGTYYVPSDTCTVAVVTKCKDGTIRRSVANRLVAIKMR